MKNIMVDNETLATTADAVIMSIGAIKFDLESGAIDDAGFYASISIESNLQRNRRINEDTLMWWLKQPAAAQQVFYEPKIVLEQALIDLSDWIGADDYQVWSMGADFDLPMLAHAYTQHQIEVPWKFWNSRCMRTYKNLPGAPEVALESTGVKHNAMADALNQVRQAQAIYKTLFAEKVAAAKEAHPMTRKRAPAAGKASKA